MQHGHLDGGVDRKTCFNVYDSEEEEDVLWTLEQDIHLKSIKSLKDGSLLKEGWIFVTSGRVGLFPNGRTAIVCEKTPVVSAGQRVRRVCCSDEVESK